MRIQQSEDVAGATPTQDVRVVAASALEVVERQPAFKFSLEWDKKVRDESIN